MASRPPSYALCFVAAVAAGCAPVADDFEASGGSSCVRCHGGVVGEGVDGQPGERVGIELAHPPVDGVEFTCVSCHGGDASALIQSQAHVVAVEGEPDELYALTSGELDAVRPERVRFVNPGDLRVAGETCGAEGCHPQAVERVKRNMMATYSGEHAVMLYRSGLQDGPAPVEGIYAVEDPEGGREPGTLASLEAAEDPPPLAGDEAEVAPWLAHYMNKGCATCHLWSSGPNSAPGVYRSSGCTACHMIYADDGVSKSADPNARAAKGPHPIKHELTTAIPSEQCGHCHFRGARIWPSYQGLRESAADGLDPPNAVRRAEAKYGRPPGFYVEREDATDPTDTTPPDVHYTAGMWCIDCHVQEEMHGDGRLHSDLSGELEVTCETCHGTSDAVTDMTTTKGRVMPNLSRDEEGTWLTRKADGERLPVSQIKDLLDAVPEEQRATSLLWQAKAPLGENDFNHSKKLQCYSCHSGWMQNCYGCHVTVDMRGMGKSTLTGESSPGSAKGSRRFVATDSLVLMFDTRGRIAPSMPAERMFVTAINAEGDTVFADKVRPAAEGATGHGQRPVNPHTVQRFGNGLCSNCHPKADGSNTDAVWGVAGLGTGRFQFEDAAGTTHILDRIVDEATYESQVTVGHEGPEVARPLDQETIEGMLDVEAPM